MKKISIILILAFFNVNSYAVEFSKSFLKYSAEWQLNNGVRQVFAAPLGNVYKFQPMDGLKLEYYEDKISLNSMQFDLFPKKGDFALQRYLIIDFKIRIFPAISKETNSKFRLKFFASKNLAYNVKTNKDIAYSTKNVIGCIGGMSSMTNMGFSNKEIMQLYRSNEKGIRKPESLFVGKLQLNSYNIASVRYIFDTQYIGEKQQKNMNNININGRLYCYPNNWTMDEINRTFMIRSFGLVLEKSSLKMKKMAFDKEAHRDPREYIEISTPIIYTTNSLEDIQKLPNIEYSLYPYNSYFKNSEDLNDYIKISKLKNPDEIYANSLQLLKGQDLVTGFKLLEKIAKKYHHILAMNQLGICYLRGYGVKKDLEKAYYWFNNAAKYNLEQANVYRFLVKMQMKQKPFFTKKERSLFISFLENNRASINNEPTYEQKYLSELFNQYYLNRSGTSPLVYLINNKIGVFYNIFHFRPLYYFNIIDEADFDLTGPRVLNLKKVENMPDLRYLGNFSPYLNDNLILNNSVLDMNCQKISNAKNNYYYGQLLVSLWTFNGLKDDSLIQKALKYFEQGANSNDLECMIEIMHCKARLGTLTNADFNSESDLKFANHPLYYILKFIVNHPNYLGVKEFLQRDNLTARKIWQKNLNIKSKFLLTFEGFYQFYHYGFDTLYYRIIHRQTKELKNIYNYLNQLAKANVPEAIYYKSFLILNNKWSNQSLANTKRNALNLLEKLKIKNHLMATYQLINYQFNNNDLNKNWLKELMPLLKLEYAPAWLLASDIYSKLNKLNSNNPNIMSRVINFYKKAAKLGAYEAYDRLANIYYKNNNKSKASIYWEKFIYADNNNRECNFYEPFSKAINLLNPLYFARRVKSKYDFKYSPKRSKKVNDKLKKNVLTAMFNYYDVRNYILWIKDKSDPESLTLNELLKNYLKNKKIKAPKYLEDEK